MGCCVSTPEATPLPTADEEAISVPAGGNKPLKEKKRYPPWTADEPMTNAALQRKRDEFWDTAPTYDVRTIHMQLMLQWRIQRNHNEGGRREIWEALRAACEAEDLAMTQAIVDSAGITFPHGLLTEGYDELGNRYSIPVYCITKPTNIIETGAEGSSQSASHGKSSLADAGTGSAAVGVAAGATAGAAGVSSGSFASSASPSSSSSSSAEVNADSSMASSSNLLSGASSGGQKKDKQPANESYSEEGPQSHAASNEAAASSSSNMTQPEASASSSNGKQPAPPSSSSTTTSSSSSSSSIPNSDSADSSSSNSKQQSSSVAQSKAAAAGAGSKTKATSQPSAGSSAAASSSSESLGSKGGSGSAGAGMMTIKVRLSTSKDVKVTLPQDATIGQLKKQVAEQSVNFEKPEKPLAADKMRVFWLGKELAEITKISKIGLPDHAVIQVLVQTA